MSYPIHQPRRLRLHPQLRRLIRKNALTKDHLVYPLFVREGRGLSKEISSMPGVFQKSLDQILKEMEEAAALAIPAVLSFGIPSSKDDRASQAYTPKGIIQRTVQAIKKNFPDVLVITDVCLCEYMDHGHCGVIKRKSSARLSAEKCVVDNRLTLPLLQKTALSHAEAGADVVAPSAMMDGMVHALRSVLDDKGFHSPPILSYSAKFASSFYGPFREAAQSSPQFGDRKGYQMDYSNLEEALRETAFDIEEGADMVMVKPALAYLDVIRALRERFHVPLAAYHVSGEYSMVKAAALRGWLNEKEAVLEILNASVRAGANILITYWAKDVVKWLK